MATSLQRGKGFGGAQWVLLERWCRRCRCLHLVCAASVPSSGFSCHRYHGALFAAGHRAECGNSRHLSDRTLTSSALSSQGHRSSRQGQTITRHYSLSCNELEIEKRNWAMTADTILWFKGDAQKWNGHSNSITLLLCFYRCYVSCYLCFFLWWKIECLIAAVFICICAVCPASNFSFNSFSSVDADFSAILLFVRGKWGPCHICACLPLWLSLSQFEGET